MTEGSPDAQKASGMCPHGNLPGRCKTCTTESENKITLESARDILGEKNIFGAERVKEEFGVELATIPEIPFSKTDIEQAKNVGEVLMLRVNRFDNGTPITIKNLVERSRGRGESTLSSVSDISDELDWVEGMAFQEVTTPALEWKLVRTQPIEETKHLSFDAQRSFMAGAFDRLQQNLDEMSAYWDELLQGGTAEGLRQHIDHAKAALPTLETLKTLRASLPKEATLPSVIEMLYDAKMRGASLFENMAVVTNDTVSPIEGELERPIDLSFLDGKASLHVRRDKRFGRPHKLGNTDEFISGIPIGYIQH